ncbi:hypothetical protein FRB99_001998 [Tulasnella sp. 403]|nr:hypothetical protein FRB99_001998 [Tulasnella sp. 403]
MAEDNGFALAALTPFNSSSTPMRLTPRGGTVCPFQGDDGATVGLVQPTLADAEPIILGVKFLAHGGNGCVYDVVSGLDTSKPAVVKTPRLKAEPELPEAEIKALTDFKQLVYNGRSVDDQRPWIVMEKLDGVVLWDHPDYQTKFPLGYLDLSQIAPDKRAAEVKSCKVFMTRWYKRILSTQIGITTATGWVHNDRQWENYLIPLGQTSKINFIDWGQATNVGEDPEDRDLEVEGLKLSLVPYLSTHSALPLQDNEMHQGICSSRRRDKGKSWEHPRDVIKRARERAV